MGDLFLTLPAFQCFEHKSSVQAPGNMFYPSMQHKTLLFRFTIETLFPLKPTALHFTSSPSCEHYSIPHCGSSLPINLYLPSSVEQRAYTARCISDSMSKTSRSTLNFILPIFLFQEPLSPHLYS